MKGKFSKKTLSLGLALTLLASLLLGSGAVFAQEAEPPEPESEPPAAPDEKTVENKAVKRWTFMVYMAADNNLEAAALNDFLEMSSVGSTSNVNIVVQLDRIPGYDATYGDWKDTRRFYITNGMTPVASNGTSIGEADMGDDATLQSFINWAKSNYPATRYALVLWNHGNGFQPMSDDISSAGVAWDDTSGSRYLTNRELSDVLSAVTGNGTNKLELVGFDACLMAQMEVHQHVKSYANYGVGSEKTEPNDGWPYDTILTYLKNNSTVGGLSLANKIADLYYASFGNNETQSAVRYGSQYNTVITKLNNFSDKLIAKINADPAFKTKIGQALTASIKLDPNGNFVDLSDFALKIKNRTPAGSQLYTAASELRVAISNMVSRNKVGPAYLNAKGVTIFFPKNRATWGSWIDAYKTWQYLPRDTRWEEFLNKYYKTELVVALTWGNTVADLDAHLWLPATNPYHVYYGARGSLSAFPEAWLDADDSSYQGPENILVDLFYSGSTIYAVKKNGAEPTTLKNASARVQVYRNGTLIKTLYSSQAGGTASGTWWKVFTYNKSTNTFSWNHTLMSTSPAPY